MRSQICVCAICILLYVESCRASIAESGADQIRSDLAKCQSIRNKLVQYENVSKTLSKKRQQHIKMYEMLSRNLQFNVTQSQSTIIDYAKKIISNNDLIKSCTEESKNKELKLYNVTLALNNTLIQLGQSNETIANISYRNSVLESELSDKEIQIEKQISTIDELSKSLSNQSSLVQRLQRVNAVQLDELSDKRHQIYELKADATKSTAAIEALSKEIAELKAQLNSRDQNIEHLNALLEDYVSCCHASSCVAFGASNEVHVLKVDGVKEPFEVLCNSQLAGNGWTVIQRRINGKVDFYRSWEEYKKGFGTPSGEFFIGLERLYHMTKAKPQQLYIWLEDFSNKSRSIIFDDFKLGSEQEAYALLSLGNHNGNTENALRMSIGQKFTTFDRDNDADEVNNCAEHLRGAWWYDHCGYSNLNGLYKEADLDYDFVNQGIFWVDEDFHDSDYSLKSVLMMIRPKDVKETP